MYICYTYIIRKHDLRSVHFTLISLELKLLILNYRELEWSRKTGVHLSNVSLLKVELCKRRLMYLLLFY
jgi:hypothetical protein